MRTTALGAAIGLAHPLRISAPAGALSARSAGETCDGLAATIVAPTPTTYPSLPVLGTAGDDVIVGTDRGDVIEGDRGNDVICGLEIRR